MYGRNSETKNRSKSKKGQDNQKIRYLMLFQMILVTLFGEEGKADDKQAEGAAQCAYLKYSFMSDIVYEFDCEEDSNYAFSVDEHRQKFI